MIYTLESGLVKVKEDIKKMNETKKSVIVGVAGGSGSGKSYFANMLEGRVLSVDDYYKGGCNMKDNNFDDPDAVDLELLKWQLALLGRDIAVLKPVYNFKNHSRKGYAKFSPNNIIVVEGLFALNYVIKNSLDIKVFIDSPSKKRLARRIIRDLEERSRTREEIIKQWNETVEPMYLKHILPTKDYADIIIEN